MEQTETVTPKSTEATQEEADSQFERALRRLQEEGKADPQSAVARFSSAW